MADVTTRDDIWRTALNRCVRGGETVVPEDIANDTGASERTVRDCLLVMAQSGWLDRTPTPSGTVRYKKPVNIEHIKMSDHPDRPDY